MTIQTYAIHELVNFAVEIEKNGAKFYRTMSGKTSAPEAKAVYLLLEQEELHHQQAYQRLLNEVTAITAAGADFSDEYHLYLRAIVEKVVFDPSEAAKENALKSDLEVIDYALGRERDSILYYHEMKKFIAVQHHHVIDQIISEEQLHIIKLLDLREHVE